MITEKDRARFVQHLLLELERLRTRVEVEARYTEVLEGKLRDVTLSVEKPTTVVIDDPIEPLGDGICLRSNVATAYENSAVKSKETWDEPAVDNSWWPRADSPKEPLLPAPGWRNYSLRGSVTRVVGVSVCGMSRQSLKHVVESIAIQQERLRDFIPVFLTDSLEFGIFRKYGFVFEYFPSPEERARYSGTISWAEYANRRRSFLEKKWGLSHVICIGDTDFCRIGAAAEAREEVALQDFEYTSVGPSANLIRKSPPPLGANGHAVETSENSIPVGAGSEPADVDQLERATISMPMPNGKRSEATIDEMLAQQILRKEFSTDVGSLKRIVSGTKSTAFTFTSKGKEYVARFNARAHGFKKDCYAYDNFSSKEIPVPRTCCLGSYDSNLHFSVTERATGVSVNHLGSEKISRLLPVIIKTLEQIHAYSPPAENTFGSINLNGTGNFSSWNEFLSNRTNRLRNDPNLSSFLLNKFPSRGAFDGILDTLEERICMLPRSPCQLVHGDYHWSNIISDGEHVTGVLDWELSMWGDGLYDLAHLFYSRSNWYSAFMQDYCRKTIPDQDLFEERLDCYRIQKGIKSILFWSQQSNWNECQFVWDKLCPILQKQNMIMVN